MKRSPSKRFYC